MSQDFDRFMKVREAASLEFVNGDVGPLHEISTRQNPATIFGPQGDCIESADNVNAANAKSAATFGPGSKNKFKIMHIAADQNIAYWTGIQNSTVKMRGKDEPVEMNLRVTEIFRREEGEWKLMHRHADARSNNAVPAK